MRKGKRRGKVVLDGAVLSARAFLLPLLLIAISCIQFGTSLPSVGSITDSCGPEAPGEELKPDLHCMSALALHLLP